MPPVQCDEVQIQQVILNLVRNAMDAMEEVHFSTGNQIEVSTVLCSKELVEVSVRDRGPGGKLDSERLVCRVS